MDTLVLNSAYIAIDRITWQEAVANIFTGRAEVVEEYEDWTVRSPSVEMRVPSIIRFLGKVIGLFRRGPRFNRRNVYLRDKGTCQYCGSLVSKAEFTYDHVVPRCQGGKTTWSNVVISCVGCNQRKSDKTPSQAGMRLRAKPTKPNNLNGSHFSVQWSEDMPPTWRDYLVSVSYWTEKLAR